MAAERTLIDVIGPKEPGSQTLDLIEIIERKVRGAMLPVVTYKGNDYIVWGGPGKERIYVGIKGSDETPMDSCQSCFGIVEAADLETHTVAPLVGNGAPTQFKLCSTCRSRLRDFILVPDQLAS